MSATDGDTTEGESGVRAKGGVSPYSTGGGGVTFERRVAAAYLALLLTGEGAPELGDGRRVVSVAFQQAPRVPVDDLVVLAARPAEESPTLELAIGVRRAPKIVQSDSDTKDLFAQYIAALPGEAADAERRRFALVVSGVQTHAQQLAELAALASQQQDATGFFDLLGTEGRFKADLVGRLGHVRALVASALTTPDSGEAEEALVQQRTWALLSRLSVLMPRFEEPDIADWESLRNRLTPVARGNDLVAAGSLRDRLESLAATFAPSAATVDRHLLLTQVHPLLDLAATRAAHGWQVLDHLQTQALAGARDHAGSIAGGPTLRLDRRDEGAALIATAGAGSGQAS
jgi:hypothetical protein